MDELSKRSMRSLYITLANSAVSGAMRLGLITPATECENCGIEKKTVGHHDDYRKPVDVRWLCQKCHMTWHATNGSGLLPKGLTFKRVGNVWAMEKAHWKEKSCERRIGEAYDRNVDFDAAIKDAKP